jgi:ATP-dependent Lon protease
LRAGIKTVMLPARNKRDLEDIPADAREQLTFVWLETVDQAIAEALVPAEGKNVSSEESAKLPG